MSDTQPMSGNLLVLPAERRLISSSNPQDHASDKKRGDARSERRLPEVSMPTICVASR